jgi:hypothetical protein
MTKKPRIAKATETDIAFGVLVIAAFQSNGIATFQRLRREIPIHIRLSNFDIADSVLRPNEENWVQTLRGIQKIVISLATSFKKATSCTFLAWDFGSHLWGTGGE